MEWCLKVPVAAGEDYRSSLREQRLLDISRAIKKEGEHLLIPVNSPVAMEGAELLERELPSLERRETDYRRIVDLPEYLKELLPSSYDIIGEVAILKLDEGLIPFAGEIADALMAASPRLRSVALDRGIKGETRVRDLVVLRGDHGLGSVHTEYGVSMEVDPSLAYFNPRLSRERMRVAAMVREGEVIADLFAGVGPFPLVICRHARPQKVYAVDINSEAVAMMERNISRNRMDDRIVALHGDARSVLPRLPPLDRAIMNLPQMAEEFLDIALERVRRGGKVHLYRIMERDELTGFQEGILNKAGSLGYEVEVESVHELKSYSPSMSVYCLDIIC